MKISGTGLCIIFLFTITTIAETIAQGKGSGNYLLRFFSSGDDDSCGYVNTLGDTIIEPGRFKFCFTDTLRYFAHVLNRDNTIVAINSGGEILFEVYPFDNGPDYPSEGLFRIVDKGKIGYADSKGQVVIEPEYQCAFPFKDGRAKVAHSCKKIKKGEHSVWDSDSWFYIDKAGEKIQIE